MSVTIAHEREDHPSVSVRCSARACRASSGRRLRAVHRPPACLAAAADTRPQPPRRRVRSSLLPSSTSNLWIRTIRSLSRRSSATSGMEPIGPGRGGSTANARPGVARIPAGTRVAGSASRAPSAAARSRAGMTAQAVPVMSASRCATSTGSPAASARFEDGLHLGGVPGSPQAQRAFLAGQHPQPHQASLPGQRVRAFCLARLDVGHGLTGGCREGWRR